MTIQLVRHASVLMAAAAFVVAQPVAVPAQDTDSTLRISTWGGSWRDSIDEHFVSRLPEEVSVEYVLGNPADNLAKLIAANRQGQVPFDVMEGSPELTGSMVEAGLLASINYDNIPNAEALPEWARSEYEVIGVLTQDGVAYNAEKFEEAGIEPPQSYMDLADPRLEGHVAFPDVSHVQHWNAVVGVAYERGGSEENMEPAVEGVNEIAPDFFYSSSTDLASRFSAGDIWAAPWHAGWVVRLKRTGVPLDMAYTPFGDERGALWGVPEHVVAGTEETESAEAFINAYLDPEAQYAHASATGVVPVLSEARRKMREESTEAGPLFLTDAAMDNAFQIDWDRLDAAAWRELWTRDVMR